MEISSKPSLQRAPLGSLDSNSHLLSPRPASHANITPHKVSSASKQTSTFVTPGKGLYSLKDNITSSPAQRITTMVQPTPMRSLYSERPRSNEKRKDAPTSAYCDAECAERAVKQARLSESMGHDRRDSGHGHSRQSSACGHGHKLFGEIATRVEAEEDTDLSQGTIANSSFNDEDMNDSSQLTAVSAPDIHGPAPADRGIPSPENLRANAQALKLRLQFAMYKLQTHQEHIPLSHLRVVPKQPRFPGVISSPASNRAHASRPLSPVRLSLSPHQQRELRRGSKDVQQHVGRSGHSRTPSNERGGKEMGNYASRNGHSRTPSGGLAQRKSPTDEFQMPRSSQSTMRRLSLPTGVDNTDDESDAAQKYVDRDTVSPSIDHNRDSIATPSYGGRQDRLLSLANAVEHASSQERQERERSN